MSRHALGLLRQPAAAWPSSALPPSSHKAGGAAGGAWSRPASRAAFYPIHPTATEILGHKAYRSLRELPDARPNLAVILVRPDLVPGALTDCAELRVPAVVVITAGFGETGRGRQAARASAMTRQLREAGGRMIGPNCAGLFSAVGPRERARLGRACRPHRGALAERQHGPHLRAVRAREGPGHERSSSRWAMPPTCASPSTSEYLQADPDTRVIVAYLEGFETGEGRADLGADAASSKSEAGRWC